MNHEGSVPCSQESATGLYPETFSHPVKSFDSLFYILQYFVYYNEFFMNIVRN